MYIKLGVEKFETQKEWIYFKYGVYFRKNSCGGCINCRVFGNNRCPKTYMGYVYS